MTVQTWVSFAAVVVSLLAVLGGVYFQTREDRRNRLREHWKQVSDQRERLRPEYVRLLEAARWMQTVLHREKFVLNTETPESRDQALGEGLAKALTELEASRPRLILEGREKVVDAIDEVWRIFVANRSAKGVISLAGPDSAIELAKQMGQHEEAIEQAAERLKAALVTDIQSLVPPD